MYKEAIFMRNKTIFGLAALIVFMVVGVVFVVWRIQMRSGYSKDVQPHEKPSDFIFPPSPTSASKMPPDSEHNELIWTPSPTSVSKMPPGSEPGFKWVQYEGEEVWHKVPIRKKEPVVDKPKPPPQPAETEPVSRDYKPKRVVIPEGITDPEVKKAWERVEYIAKNIWEWGGEPSHRVVELIDELMPAPDGFSGPSGHRDLEETIDLLGELAWSGDPRAAQVIATYLCEGRVGGNDPVNAMVEIGPPAVPYFVPYMLDMEWDPLLRSRALEVLGRIAERHREELEGIVDYIIIPRMEAILSEERPDYHEKEDALEYLPSLK
ncbi:hypothetical protein C6497_09510 [Candidatus Poribacteria bacterium]|nr:MAG: hypothetical protein C6497_09510 [Candidatus Poribacteria bacterium]